MLQRRHNVEAALETRLVEPGLRARGQAGCDDGVLRAMEGPDGQLPPRLGERRARVEHAEGAEGATELAAVRESSVERSARTLRLATDGHARCVPEPLDLFVYYSVDVHSALGELRGIDLLLHVWPALLAAVICEIVVPRWIERPRLAIARNLPRRTLHEDQPRPLQRRGASGFTAALLDPPASVLRGAGLKAMQQDD